MRTKYIFLLAVLMITACDQPQQMLFRSNGRIDYQLKTDEEAMLDSF